MVPLSQTRQKETPAIIRAFKGESAPGVPFWLMRQAGRYLPEYRALRAEAGSFLDLCFNPELAAEVTLQPLRRFDMDAAIIFSDILVIPHALGQEVGFEAGEGPRLGNLDIGSLRLDMRLLAPVYKALDLTRHQLPPDKALIGFAGAPWTLACYMINGRGDGVFAKAREYAERRSAEFEGLIQLLTGAVAQHLCAQIRHGAQAVQLFDSWAGLLPESLFARFVTRPAREVIALVKEQHPDVPVIGFPRGAGALYPGYAAGAGVDCLGVDQEYHIEEAVKSIDPAICLQGNLDPAALLEGGTRLKDETLRILNAVHRRPFVFNLGHGVIKETPPEHVAALAKVIREFRR
jgi:uroporphyrinogen decarboxylase